MPTYAYACTSCGHTFDAVQSFSDASLTECPECGGALRKQYGSIGVTFNGSGFYRTDSRSGGKGGPKKDAGGSTSGSDAGGSGSSSSGSGASGSGSSASSAPAKSTKTESSSS